MESHIPISWLNDFIFCPYSIYLHQVFDSGEEETYSAKPQQKGKTVHKKVDNEDCNEKAWYGCYVVSDKLRLYGKIDIYYPNKKLLIEQKRKIKQLYKGFYYQIWAQYFCMIEMGYEVDSIQLLSKQERKHIQLSIPREKEYNEIFMHVRKIASFEPLKFNREININKCKHCIYSMLCDKTRYEHVYT